MKHRKGGTYCRIIERVWSHISLCVCACLVFTWLYRDRSISTRVKQVVFMLSIIYGNNLQLYVFLHIFFFIKYFNIFSSFTGPDIDSPEGRKKFVGMDSPPRKEVASQTQDSEQESEEERNSQKSDDEFSQPISIRLSVLDADKVASLTSSQSVSTSTAACGTGDITGRASHDTGALSSTESDQNLPKSGKYDNISPKHSSLEDDDTVERDNGRRNVSSGMAGRATTYETIC